MPANSLGMKTIDVPQADSLPLIRRLVDAVCQTEMGRSKQLAAATAFSERHVRYRLAAARILGFVTIGEGRSAEATPSGHRLSSTMPGSIEERAEFERAIAGSETIRAITPSLLSLADFDVAKVAQRISRLSGLAPSTARRRATALRAWRRDLRKGELSDAKVTPRT